MSLLLGSHLDSVPFGGRFDGALGLLAAYEVLRTIRDADLSLPFHLEAIDFTDEEGSLVGLLGSRALAGTLAREELRNPRGGRERLLQGLGNAGLTETGLFSAARRADQLSAFLELHIEQGPVLHDMKADVGIVTALVGIASLQISFVGRADHAGTTPMGARRDASLGAADFMLRARERVMSGFPQAVLTFGQLTVGPGSFNIVPGTADLGVEFRAPELDQLKAIRSLILQLAEDCARTWDLEISHQDLGEIHPTRCSDLVQRAFVRASEVLGLRSVQLASGAGHDTMAMASICPAGMIFIPSTGGSHSPREHAAWQDCVNGANLLLHATLELAEHF